MASSGIKINNKKRKSFAGSSSGVADGVSPSPSEPKKREGGVPEKSEGSKKKKRKKSKKGTKKKNDGGGGGGKNDAKESGDGSDGKVDLTAEANAYVETWGKNRVSWKFNKKTQTYLLKKCYDPSVLPKANFSIFLKYIDGLQGGGRATTLKKAKEILEVESLLKGEEGKHAVEVGASDEVLIAIKRRKKLQRIRLARANAIARVLA